MTRAAIVCLLVVLAGLSGCIGKKAEEDVQETQTDLLDARQQEILQTRAAPIPKTYVFPGQAALPPKTVYFNGTVTSEGNLGYEDRNDRGGNDYNTKREVFDVAPHVPPGQPVEMRITLYYAASPGSSADLDIYVDVPGIETDWAPDNGDEFNWKFSVQRMVVNTVGAAGRPLEVGVQIANGKTASDWPYTLRVDFTYAQDAVAPRVPYAFRLPEGASGIQVSSVKAGGEEHVRGKFVVLSAADELLAFVDFNDIDIPTESVFVPLPGPGEYVLYAAELHGGFFRLEADAPVPAREVRVLQTGQERVVVSNAPTPGVGQRDWLHDGTAVTPAQGGATVQWSPSGFPLHFQPFVGGEQGATVAWAEVRVANAQGEVAWLQRVARHDDERGSLGYTQDQWNSGFRAEHLARGDHTVWFAQASAGVEVGFLVTTLVR